MAWADANWKFLVFLIWVGISAYYLSLRADAIHWFALGDTDDNMRYLQVRDWLNGQGWFDLRQYRMNPPDGANIHWSRIVDLPIAALMLTFRLFLSEGQADRWACAVAPLLPLLPLMFGLSFITRRLSRPGSLSWIIAAFGPLGAPMGLNMYMPLRVDHHGWQLALVVAMLAGIVDRKWLRGGLVAGMASALSVAIGMEMMVYLAGAGGLIALRWVFKEGAARRMAPYALALGSGTGLLYAAFASTDNQGIACDAISLNWTATLILAAGGMVLLSLLRLQGWPKRLAAGALVGAIVAAFTYHFWPQCITSVYQIDPELDRLWLSHIREAKPITAQSLSSAIQIVALPVGGLIAALVGCFAARGDKERLWAWGSVMLMVAFALGLTFWQIRSGPAAQLVAIPAVAWVGYGALEWLVRGSIGERLSALLALLIALLSFNGDFIYPQLQKVGLVAPPAPATAATKARDARFKRINTANGRCRTQPALVALNQLPPATIMTMVDLGPRLIAMTHHSAIAGPYHRNGKAILDLHHAYDGDAATFLDTARRHHATYFLLCPDFPEGTIYRARSPGGMYDQLEKGQIPVWLKPVELKTGYKLPYTLYRIEGGAQSVENLGDRIEPGSNLSAVGKERDVPAR
jgi:hypothetical protein